MEKNIGSILTMLRGDKSQKEIAESIGITPSALSNYEQGIRIPRDEVKIKLAEFYGKSVEEIFFVR